MSNKKYPSKYSNGKQVSAAQYITEIICERMAQKNKQDLHYRFWLNKEWQKFYKNQIASANALLKKYPDTAIIRALNNAKASKIYSLRAPHLPAIIEQENDKLKTENKDISLDLSRPKEIKYLQKNIKSNIISKLKGLDNES